MNKVNFIRIGKYLVSGGSVALINLVCLYVLTEVFHVWYLASAIVAFVIAFVLNFFLQKFWTFRNYDREQMHTQLVQFFLLSVVNLILNAGLLYLLTDMFHVWYLLSQVIILGALAIMNYLVYQKVIFLHK